MLPAKRIWTFVGDAQVKKEGHSLTCWNSDIEVNFQPGEPLPAGFFPAVNIKVTVEIEQIAQEGQPERSMQKVVENGGVGVAENNYAAMPEKKRNQGLHVSTIVGIDTRKVSGVGAIGAESMEVVKQFEPGEVFRPHGWEGDDERKRDLGQEVNSETASVDNSQMYVRNVTRKAPVQRIDAGRIRGTIHPDLCDHAMDPNRCRVCRPTAFSLPEL